jgi:hypothetical protein
MREIGHTNSVLSINRIMTYFYVVKGDYFDYNILVLDAV